MGTIKEETLNPMMEGDTFPYAGHVSAAFCCQKINKLC